MLTPPFLQGKVVDTYSDEQIDEIFFKARPAGRHGPLRRWKTRLWRQNRRAAGGPPAGPGRKKMANAAVNEDFSALPVQASSTPLTCLSL